MFGCGPGRRQFGFDFSSLEARIQGHYVFNYKDGEELAASLIAEKPNDCFDLNTLILTKSGWVHSSELDEDTLIAQWEPITKHITYSKPSQIIRRNHEGTMITVKGSRLDIKVTPNHIMAVYNRDTKEYLKLEARDLKEYVLHNPNSFIPANGYEPLKDHLDYDLAKVDCVLDRDCGFIYKSRDLDTITMIATSQRLSGSSALIIEKEENGSIMYQTIVGKAPLNQDGFKLIYEEIGEEVVHEDVWCVTIPTHHVMVKRNNSIYVTGNCHCLPSTNQVLTSDRGWVSFDDLKDGEAIAQWDNGIISYEVPSEIIRGTTEQPMYRFSNQTNLSMTTTGNHRILLNNYRQNKYVVKTAEDLFKLKRGEYAVPLTGVINNLDLPLSDDFIRLLVATQADAHLGKGGTYSYRFSKLRKIRRFKTILDTLNIKYSMNTRAADNVTSFIISKPDSLLIGEWLDGSRKSFKNSLLGLSHRQAIIFLKEVQYWAGTLTKNNNIIYDVHDKVSRDFVQTLAHINGYVCTANEYVKPNPFSGEMRTIYRANITNTLMNPNGNRITKFSAKTPSLKRERVSGITDVACVTVPSSYFLCKEGDRIFVTGNSINARKLGITRDNAKSFSYACMYGAQPAKLAKMLRISLKEAERLYEAYWEAVPALKELKERLENFWKKTGKQYILGIDGRKLYVRSQHSLVNLLLQSAGALCVKYTLVGVTRRLEELGQLGDPLLDTEEDSKSKVYQMIAYHDEAQYDCPENYFKTHYFPTEDEAKAAQKESFGSSTVGHDDNGYYFTENNTLSQFIEEEIFRVCMDLDIRVPLGMEYITGMNWANCH